MRKPWNRGGLRSYLIVCGLLAGKTTLPWVLGALPLLFGGIFMHIWAKGCLRQKQEVTMSGPYRFMRHPFYLGNLLIDLSIVLMSGWLPLLFAFPFVWAFVYLRTIRREEREMTELFGQKYKDYMARVPAIFPTIKPLPPIKGFSWRNPNIVRTEIPRCLRFLSYPFLFLIRSELNFDSISSSSFSSPLLFYSLVAFIFFNGLAWQVKSAVKGKNLWYWRITSSRFVRLGVLSLFFAFGLFINYFQLESDSVTLSLGISFMVLSFLLQSRLRNFPALGDVGLFVGASFLLEIPWLCIIPLLLVVAPSLVHPNSPDSLLSRSRGEDPYFTIFSKPKERVFLAGISLITFLLKELLY